MSQWYVTTEGAEAQPCDDDCVMNELRKVSDGQSEFIVCEPEPNSEASFAQASVWTEGVILRGSWVAEVRLPNDGGFRQWRLRTKEFGQIEDAFSRYMAGESPEGPGWDDVTDEFTDS